MSYFKVSYLLENTNIPPFVLGAFFSRSIFTSNTIYTEASSGAGNKPDELTIEKFKYNRKIYLDKLNFVSYPFVWELAITNDTIFKAKLIIENYLNLTKENFFYRLYYKLATECPWVNSEKLTDKKKDFIRGFFELRGSIDTTATYISQDYFSDGSFDLKKYNILTDFVTVPYYVLNLNFRNLQKQYYEGTNQRNTQFRINSKWYMKYIGMMDDFKIDKFAGSHSSKDKIIKIGKVSYFDIEEPNYNKNKSVDNKFNFYAQNILQRNLTKEEIKKLREIIGYDSKSKQLRDPSLKEFVRLYEPDECVCCKDLYDIKDRTFIHKRTNRPYFEIHHVISLGNNKELDDENNLVKLCPVCHSCLKRGTGLENDQKKLIEQILENSSKALNFCKNILGCTDKNKLIEKIYAKLK